MTSRNKQEEMNGKHVAKEKENQTNCFVEK